MKNAAFVLIALMVSSPSAIARQVCADFNDHPQFRSAYQEILSDGSVMFTEPQVLFREGEYMEISMAHGSSAAAFCMAHQLKLSQTHSSVSKQSEFVEISHKVGSNQEFELRLVMSPRLVAKIIICRTN